jgi:hypothetical protein
MRTLVISPLSTDDLDRLFPRLGKFLRAREEWSLLAQLPGEGAPRVVLEWHRRGDERIEVVASSPGRFTCFGTSSSSARRARHVLSYAFPEWSLTVVRVWPKSKRYQRIETLFGVRISG